MCKNWFFRYLFGTAIKRNLLWSKCLHPVVIHPHAQSIFIEFILDSFLPGCKSAFRFLPQLVRFSFQLGWSVNICFAKTGCCLWCNTYKEPPIHQTHLDIILFPKILRKVVSVSLKKKKIIMNKTSFSRRPQCLETSDFASNCTDLIPRPMLGLLI